jgi:hypothetical protein
MDDALIARLSGCLGITVPSTRLRLQRLFSSDMQQSLGAEARFILELIKSMDDTSYHNDMCRKNRIKIPIVFNRLPAVSVSACSHYNCACSGILNHALTAPFWTVSRPIYWAYLTFRRMRSGN